MMQSPEEKHEIHNLQTRIIAGVERPENGNYHDVNLLDTAIKNIDEKFDFVGLNEMFDESVIALSKFLQMKSNYFVKRRKTPNKTEANYASTFSKNVTSIIIRNNSLDIELHRYVYDRMKKIASDKVGKLDIFSLRIQNLLYRSYLTGRRLYKVA